MEPPPSVHGPHKEAPGSAKSPAGALEPTQPRHGDPSQAHAAAAGLKILSLAFFPKQSSLRLSGVLTSRLKN